MIGYAIHPTNGETLEDVAAAMVAAGFNPGDIASMSRRKPDGQVISWRLTRGGDSGHASQGALPFAIEWGETPSPATTLPSMGSLESLTVTHPDASIRAAAAALGLGLTVEEGPAALVAVVSTPNGPVEIR